MNTGHITSLDGARKPLILIDQDGPLADFDSALNAVLGSAGYDPAFLVRTQWETSDDVRYCFGDTAAELVDRARHTPGFYRHLPVVDGAQRAVAGLLKAGCEVIVCTAPSLSNPTCASDKLAWLDEHFPTLRDRFTIVKDKTLVRGDLLIDDKPDVHGFLEPTWRHVRYVTAGNAQRVDGTLLQSWQDWRTLLALIG